MEFKTITIKNFKSIQQVDITDIQRALILVGKNNVGKTSILNGILSMVGQYQPKVEDFRKIEIPIEINGIFQLDERDMLYFFQNKKISDEKEFQKWYQEFQEKIPSFCETYYKHNKVRGTFSFAYQLFVDGSRVIGETLGEENLYIQTLFPKIYFVDYNRDMTEIQKDIWEFQGNQELEFLKEGGTICKEKGDLSSLEQKTGGQLTISDLFCLLEHKISSINLAPFCEKLNKNFKLYGSGNQKIQYEMQMKPNEFLSINTRVYHTERKKYGSIETLGAGFKSIYLFSLLKTYLEQKRYTVPCIIMIEDPEIFLHSQLQKAASEILYQLSKKNQIIFSTHSPNMIFNFSTKQIRQVVLNKKFHTLVNQKTNMDDILNDLGYTAGDFMNVNFVFIVEGKDDSSRLPMLLEKYYSEIYDSRGRLQRIAIIPVNSCMNIQTYAHLKYMNKLYLKDQFLLIRDSDGKNPKMLKRELCTHYRRQESYDKNNLPRVEMRNVLILKYYSFENYFLDPATMVKIGVLQSEEEFYNKLFQKYISNLSKLDSMKRLQKLKGIRIRTKEDIKNNIEDIKIYVRGHNLFDIFYGKYKGEREEEILKQYVEVAPRKVFAHILDSIDQFIYFENRKK